MADGDDSDSSGDSDGDNDNSVAIGVAESAISDASDKVEQADEALKEAQAELEKAVEERMQLEQQLEQMQQCLDRATQLSEEVQADFVARFATVDSRIEEAISRLTQAEAVLQDYLSVAPPDVKAFHDWVCWQPSANTLITPNVLHDRLNIGKEQLPHFIEYLRDREPAFRARIESYQERWESANGDRREEIKTLAQSRRELSGTLGEKIVEYALRPVGENVTTQDKTYFTDGRYTKTDLKVSGLRQPVIFGHGEGMGTQKGQSLAFEVKCGKPNYLFSQKEHMTFQAGGHKEADAHVTFCTRDIKDLPPQKEQELRDAMRKAGSPLVGMLPKKDEIDQAVWNACGMKR
jgi:predicted  nucleic acid-binding Zn-ribbon protein